MILYKKSQKSGTYGDKSEKDQHSDTFKVHMILAILCNIVNRNSLLVQNLIGMLLYRGVVKERVYDVSSMFGVSSSLSTVNRISKYWANTRNPTDEIDDEKLIKVSIDNLNFKRKFAKTVHAGGHVDGRMLNLITSQVTQRPHKHSINNHELTSQNNKPTE